MHSRIDSASKNKTHCIKQTFNFSIVSLVDGKELFLEKGTLLAEGTFAGVYTLKSNGEETNLACKEIELYHPKGQGYLSESKYTRSGRFFEAIHDINALYTLGLLIGYTFKNDVFYIVMKKIDGNTLEIAVKNASPTEAQKMYYEAYKELKKLHRKGLCI